MMRGQDVVKAYLDHHFRLVFWSGAGDQKGPSEKGWTAKAYALADYKDGMRVGILTGVEVAPGKFLHDVDIDWAPGTLIAQALLPPTMLVFGRQSKRVSHCFYTIADALPSYRYEDVDKSCLIELRGTKLNGEVGMQTMAPPSVWSKGATKEPLAFVKGDAPQPPVHVDRPELLKQRVALAAIGMLLAKHLGTNGFGHEVRLAWAGFLLRAGIGIEDLVLMGEAISLHCNNREVHDVRRAIESTQVSLQSSASKKVKGGPALAKAIGAKGKLVVSRVNEWLGRDSDFVRNAEGMIAAKNQINIKRAIELLGHELSYNQFAEQMLMDGKPLEDPQWKSLYLDIESEFHFLPPPDYFRLVVEDAAWRNGFHPVKQYLDALTWDGTPRIDAWLIKAAKADDTAYVRAISAIMLVAACRRIRQPGAKYDEMIVWESKQGAEKSSGAQALCPNPDWFSDDLRLNLQSKELIEATLGKWIIEASDLAGKRKTEIEQLKATLSRQVDGPARMAYAHFPVERPRHFIIIGTTNSSSYLTDPTGSRRFWPMVVKRFDVAWIKANRDQLWAEASAREAKGESIRLHETLWPDAARHQEQRREIDPWEGILRSALLAVEPNFDNRRRVPATGLWDALNIPIERRDRFGALRISDIMQRLGFKRTTVRLDGHIQVGYATDEPRLLEADHATREPGEDDDVVDVSSAGKQDAPF